MSGFYDDPSTDFRAEIGLMMIGSMNLKLQNGLGFMVTDYSLFSTI
jgi:hypothetical protein